jgi:hypothetical protein
MAKTADGDDKGDERFGRWKVVGSVVTFVIAVLGAITGTVSFIGQQDVQVRVGPAEHRPFERSGAVKVAVVNGSYRSVRIVGGEMLFNGRPFAPVAKVLPDARVLSDPRQSSWDIWSSGREPPFAIEGGASFAGAIMWHNENRALYDRMRRTSARVADAQQRVDTLRAWDDPDPASRAELVRAQKIASTPLKLTLRLDFEPGGTRTVPVAVVLDSPSSRPGGWYAEVLLKHGRIQAMTVTKLDEVPVIATLQLWPVGTRTGSRRVTRPLAVPYESNFGSHRDSPTSRYLERRRASGRFPLGSLPAGRYAWALLSGGKLQEAGTLITPCLALRRRNGQIEPAMISDTTDAENCSPSEQWHLRKDYYGPM